MRLDAYLFSINKYPSRSKAGEAVLRGEVLYNGKIVKPSREVVDETLITYKNVDVNFVSNGGFKLEKAFCDFNFTAKGMVFADVGASNGGFTQVLLNSGAKKVYAVDIGESQLDKTLLLDSRVKVIDNFNARNLSPKTLTEEVDGITCDVSFISLSLILKPIYDTLKSGGVAITLIKPQFECGKNNLGKSGIVKDVKARLEACLNLYNFAISLGFSVIGFTVAPIKEKKNVEYFFMLKKVENATIITKNDIETTVYAVR